MSLRLKIYLGFGGLLAIILVVTAATGETFTRYSDAAQSMMRQDYDSVRASQIMIEAIERADSAMERALLLSDDRGLVAAVTRRSAEFLKGLRLQQRSINTPGEDVSTAALARSWERYQDATGAVLDANAPWAQRRRAYTQVLVPLRDRTLTGAQVIMDLNLRSLTDRQGSAQTLARDARTTLRGFMLAGVLAAAGLALAIGRRIVRPLTDLSSSLRQIQAGNLDAAMPISSDDDELGQLAATFNEMAYQLRTLRQLDHERLLRTQRATQSAIDSLPDPVVVINTHRVVELTNDAGRRWFGFVPGTTVFAADHPWLEKTLATLSGAAAASESPPFFADYRSAVAVDRGGHERFLLPRAVAIVDERQQPIGAIIVLNDVTGLRRLDQMKSGLLSLVSHELKTPLTSMRMILHLLDTGKLGTLPNPVADLLATARQDSDRLHEIVEALLDMGRIESGQVLLDPKPHAAATLVEQAIEPFRNSFEQAGVSLHIQKVPQELEVLADAARVRHVFSNLLANALRFTPAGGSVTVGVEPKPADDSVVEYFVRDTGEGIAPAYTPRVFDRFFRAPGQRTEGSGLGLAIVKEIIEAHGGRVHVQSRPGGGTTFRFTLPLAQAARVEVPTGLSV